MVVFDYSKLKVVAAGPAAYSVAEDSLPQEARHLLDRCPKQDENGPYFVAGDTDDDGLPNVLYPDVDRDGTKEQAVENYLRSNTVPPEQASPLDVVRTALKRYVYADHPQRWFGSDGDVVKVVVLFDQNSNVPDCETKEEERQLQFLIDLKTILKSVKDIVQVGAPPDSALCYQESIELTKVRAYFTATATQKTSKGNGTRLEAKLTTGPAEHWGLSADVVLNSVSQVKYDKDTKDLQLKDKPTKFLIGVNYMLGDILSDRHRHWYDGITFKLLLEASRDPRNSLVGALGYRLKPFRKFGFELDSFSPFVGVMRTKNDQISASGEVLEDKRIKYQFAAGLSFNVDKIAGWLAKDEKKGSDSNGTKQ